MKHSSCSSSTVPPGGTAVYTIHHISASDGEDSSEVDEVRLTDRELKGLVSVFHSECADGVSLCASWASEAHSVPV